MPKRYQTSDGRYYSVAVNEWWDTTGTDIVPQGVVDKYMEANPDVGIVVEEVEDEYGELPDDGASRHLH